MSDIFNHEADAWESLEYDDAPTNWAPKPKTCNRCGKRNLFWKETPIGWRLAEGELVHTCTPTHD